MSIQAMTWVWGLEGLDTSQTMVLLALADAANDDGFACWPSQETLARKSRMSVRSVKRHIATLRDAGLIDVEMQSSTRGRMANLYRLHVGAERDFSALSRQRVKLAPSNSASGEIVDIPAKGQIDPLRNDGSNEAPKGTPMTPTKGTRVSPCNIGTVIKNHQTKPNQTEPTQEEAPVGCEGEFFWFGWVWCGSRDWFAVEGGGCGVDRGVPATALEGVGCCGRCCGGAGVA